MSEKKSEKVERKLSLRKQLQQDIVKYNQRIIYLDTQLKTTVGAKVYAEMLLKKLKED